MGALQGIVWYPRVDKGMLRLPVQFVYPEATYK